MSRLDETQRLFAEALLHRQTLAEDGALSARAEATAAGSSRMTPTEQLDVYREQFWLRHVACLAEDYPVVEALVGKAPFEDLVAAYLDAHPPQRFLIRDLGQDLASFLARTPPWKEDALLTDVARVEWAFVDAFDAPDAPPLDPASIAGIGEDDWPRARLVLHPSLQRLQLQHPAHELRVAHRAGQPVVRPRPAPAAVVVYRRELGTYQEIVDRRALALLDLLAAGERLGDAGERVAAESGGGDAVEASIGDWFARWAALGWISRVEV